MMLLIQSVPNMGLTIAKCTSTKTGTWDELFLAVPSMIRMALAHS